MNIDLSINLEAQTVDVRTQIGGKVRELRNTRRWTQAHLAQRLNLSQARLSELERGQGSFSAEQLLEIFRLFNVDASYFALDQDHASDEDRLWNAAARLGARHLLESESVLPSQLMQNVHDVLREGLVYARSPRLLTALSAVLVARADELQLHHVEEQLARLGLQHRLSWLVANTLEAINRQLALSPQRAVSLRYRRAQVVFSTWLNVPRPKPVSAQVDVLDTDIRTEKSRVIAERQRSPLSAAWGIVSELQPEDFSRAIGAANETA
ncbi:MAG: Helix-turn-helix domain [Pseudomonadota bacterium]|jgi:transcriptional regulator with XRE-family HTH domain